MGYLGLSDKGINAKQKNKSGEELTVRTITQLKEK